MMISVDEAILRIKANAMLLIADDGSEQSQCTLFLPAQFATAETVSQMAALAGSTVYAALPEDPDHAGVGLIGLGSLPIAPAKSGGVLRKAGAAEAALDLAAAAGANRATLIATVAGPDGKPASRSVWSGLARDNALAVVTIEALIAWRRERDTYVTREADANLPTEYGDFRMVGFVNRLNGEHHVALVMGEVSPEEPVLVRVHSECLTGDAFHSLKCDCGQQLAAALTAIAEEGRGILLYLRQEGRGIGLINKIKAYHLQDQGLDTEEANLALGFPSDMRDYGIGAQILSALGAGKLRLMTNNPKKLVGLAGHGIEVVERVPLLIKPNEVNRRYFETKEQKMGHLFHR